MLNELLRNAVILDTETLGLTRGAGLHELATYDLATNELHEYVLTPNRVKITTAPQEHTLLASSNFDTYTRIAEDNWTDVIRGQLSDRLGRPVLRHEVKQLLRQEMPWLAQQMSAHPHLSGGKPIGARGLNASHTQTVAGIDAALAHVRNVSAGRTVWIANAAFENKQIGAQLAASPVHDSADFKSMLETFNPDDPGPFHVTGKAVTGARTIAQQTGDWTGVWRAMLENQPKAGETAVRDIQDITRAVHSYGKKLGLTSLDAQYLGTGVDISHRLMTLAETGVAPTREAHRAAEDVLDEASLFRRSARMADTLQRATDGHQVNLSVPAKYFQLLEAHAPLLQQEQMLKRLERAATDIRTQGYTSQRTGGSPYQIQAVTPQGIGTTTSAMGHARTRFTSMDQVVQAMAGEGRYDLSPESAESVWEQLRTIDPKELPSEVHKRVQSIHSRWDQVDVNFDPARARIHGGRLKRFGGIVKSAPRIAKKYMAGAAVLSFMGAVASGLSREPEPELHNALSYGYDQWIESKEQHGLSEGAVAKKQRRAMTDFGSPYRGPTGVQQVFIDQELLDEREKLLRQKYGAAFSKTFDPFSGFTTGFKTPWQASNQYLSGESVDGSALGLRGDNLQMIDLADGYNIKAEDADTVTLTKSGFMAGVRSFFGMQRKYSFRLAGIDSTETSHGKDSYHAPQPHAEAAAEALRQMIASSSSQQVIFDPSQTTYGRGLGALVLDGKNANFALVRRGLAAHLPYGRSEDAMIDYRGLAAAEASAAQGRRGMWGHGWAQAFYEHAQSSGNRITFNTLTNKSKIAENYGTMRLLTAMESAENNPDMIAAASSMGADYNIGSDIYGPGQFEQRNAPGGSYLHEQQADLARWVKTSGRGGIQNRFSVKKGRSALDSTLATGKLAGSSVHNRRRYASFDQYGVTKALSRMRAQRQAAAQQQVLRRMHASPIGHHRM